MVTPALRPAPRAALETSATPMTKPCHPPRPCEEHGKPGPFRLPSATPYLQPRTLTPEASKTPFSPLRVSFPLLLGTHQQATEGPVGTTRGDKASQLGTGLPRTHKASPEG